jgi:dihydroorotate dehydrogenase electron transfer subunit
VSANLRQAALERGAVVRVEHLDGGLIEVTARLPHLAAAAAPGQFAQLRCGDQGGPLLRRPFSVAWTESGTCSFVFEVVGEGTRLLAELTPGDVLDSLGPLGRGFSVDAARGEVVCVSGGLGCAPFPLLVRSLRSRGVRDIIVLNGASTAERLYPADRFTRGDAGVGVVEATDDGSRGHHGFVTELLAPMVSSITAVFACGPNAMLAAVAAQAADGTSSAGSPRIAEASLEAPMGCGFGTCLGCALPLRGDSRGPLWGLCCSDGPVMPLRAVDWAALMALPAADVA